MEDILVFWKKDSKWYRDDKSFIFSVDKEKKYYPKNTDDHIFGCNSFFQFGNDIRIYDRFTSVDKNLVGKLYYNSHLLLNQDNILMSHHNLLEHYLILQR